jgi:hypothetical protein
MLCACGQENRYVAPPPPKVTVAMPVQQKVTRYLEESGLWLRGRQALPIKSVTYETTASDFGGWEDGWEEPGKIVMG